MEGSTTAAPITRRGGAIVLAAVLSTVAAQGCSHYIGTTAASYLRRVKEDPDPNVRYLAYAKLASPNCYDTPAQKADAVQVLLGKLDQGREPVASRAVILHTLGELRDPAARDAVLKATSDPEPVVRIQACVALGKVGRNEDATVLARMMTTDVLEDCRIAAIEALAELKPDDPRITHVLLGGMMQDDPATRYASLNALRKITGQDLGVDPGPWQLYLEKADATMVASRPRSEGASTAAATANPPATETAPQAAARPDETPTSLPTRDDRAQRASYPPSPKPLPPYR
ncbi:MAG: HEAT repeat domain-containing protein [Isosphaeraceae bacterium]